MKSEPKIKAASVIPLLALISMFVIVQSINEVKFKPAKETLNKNELLLSDNILDKTSVLKNEDTESNVDNNDIVITNTETNDENKIETQVNDLIVYDGLTKDELSLKINKNLNSTLSGMGELIVDYALNLGLDPYLATAIILHETGCSWECSHLVKACNNVGGQKGGPGCEGGSYKSFPTLEDGIKGFMDNLYNNYYALGLTTPEAINPKYAASTAWASKINYYMQLIKTS
ncbi:MAG: glucosaminidase domain-containing protein [Bacilli bacterium]|nr:glucosaminidase domain-containing protein [Bacilli bacterium]